MRICDIKIFRGREARCGFPGLLVKIAALWVALLFLAVPANAAWSPSASELWIRIDKEDMKLYLYEGKGKIIKTYPVAIGSGKGTEKKTRTDLITPEGTFKIWRVIQDATQLIYDPKWFGEPGEPQKGAYGAKLISFYNPWQIAVHGTNSPGSIGKKVTHGCVRLRNRDITQLVTYVKPGMRLVITGKGHRIVEKDTL